MLKKGKFKSFTLNDMVRSFQAKIGSTEYQKPINDIIEAFRIAMNQELGVDLEIWQKKPGREY